MSQQTECNVFSPESSVITVVGYVTKAVGGPAMMGPAQVTCNNVMDQKSKKIIMDDDYIKVLSIIYDDDYY